jgi:ketosteroid isomerase-like protein
VAAPMSAEDRLGVMDLIADYALRIDAGDIEGWVDNFTTDAVLEPAGGVRSGHEEIRAWVTELMGRGRVGASPPQLLHFVGLPHIRSGDGERCEVETYCVILDHDPEQRIRVPLVGRYEDTCVKVDGRWRFARRIIHGDLSAASR